MWILAFARLHLGSNHWNNVFILFIIGSLCVHDVCECVHTSAMVVAVWRIPLESLGPKDQTQSLSLHSLTHWVISSALQDQFMNADFWIVENLAKLVSMNHMTLYSPTAVEKERFLILLSLQTTSLAFVFLFLAVWRIEIGIYFVIFFLRWDGVDIFISFKLPLFYLFLQDWRNLTTKITTL